MFVSKFHHSPLHTIFSQEYISVLNAAQENTACTSAALGNAVATYDPASSMLCIKLSYSGLSGTETVSHIHGPAAIGADSGVQVNIGTLISSATQKTGCVTITAEQAVDLYNNMYYFNVHSSLCPAGEIRGQILRV